MKEIHGKAPQTNGQHQDREQSGLFCCPEISRDGLRIPSLSIRVGLDAIRLHFTPEDAQADISSNNRRRLKSARLSPS